MSGSFTRAGRVWTLAILLITASLLVGTVAANAGAARDARAVTAKKHKCKKKKGFTSKKRKCKHKLSIPGPIVRATISWPAGEVDLHAFDSAGNRSGIVAGCNTSPCPIVEGIPNATHSPDVGNGGSETFTDNIFVKGSAANREFAYAVCFYTSTTVTFTGVNRFGQSQSIPITDSGGGQAITVPGGPGVPPTFGC